MRTSTMASNSELITHYSKNPVIVSLSDLEKEKCDQMLPLAFGPESLGIIIIKDLPERFTELRSKVLESASQLAHLPDAILDQLESPESSWLIGWSKGRETLNDGVFDESKGSFYANCSFYVDPELEGPPEEEVKGKYEQYKGYTTPSIWPSEQDLPNFKSQLKELCGMMINIAVAVAKGCDRLFGGKLEGYKTGYLEHIVSTSTTTKARLLHYFPSEQDHLKAQKKDSWCGEHVDHSSLTALTSAMFLDDTKYPQLVELDKSPDPEAGLYIKNRKGEIIKVSIPRDSLAFQTGSALQEATDGNFKAVPHFVKGCDREGICRNTLAVFCQPSLHEEVGKNYKDFADYASEIVRRHH